RDVGDRLVVDRDRQDLGLQPLPATGRAGPGDHVLLELGLDVVRIGLAVAPLEVRDDPLERRLVGVLAALMAVADEDLLVLLGAGVVVDCLWWSVVVRLRAYTSVAIVDSI